jgi:hypothetical protein
MVIQVGIEVLVLLKEELNCGCLVRVARGIGL